MTCITNENHIYSHEHVGRGAAHRTSSVAPPLSSPHTSSSDKRRVFKTSGACRLTGAFLKKLQVWSFGNTEKPYLSSAKLTTTGDTLGTKRVSTLAAAPHALPHTPALHRDGSEVAESSFGFFNWRQSEGRGDVMLVKMMCNRWGAGDDEFSCQQHHHHIIIIINKSNSSKRRLNLWRTRGIQNPCSSASPCR